MKDRVDSFGQQVAEKCAINKDIGQKKKTLASELNVAFQSGELIDRYKDTLKEIDKPILVDFNNVLVNNSGDLEPNLSAKKFIDDLEQIGQVVVVTTATDWDMVHDSLEKFGLWTDKMILMVLKNYHPSISITDDDNESYYHLAQSDFEVLKKRSDSAPSDKKIGEVFGKDFDIPLIDDNRSVAIDNPGIHSIVVAKWFTEKDGLDYDNYIYLKKLVERRGHDSNIKKLEIMESGLSGEALRLAVEEVRKVYEGK